MIMNTPAPLDPVGCRWINSREKEEQRQRRIVAPLYWRHWRTTPATLLLQHTHTPSYHTHYYHTHSACTQQKRWQFCLELTRCRSLQWASSSLPWPTSPSSCSAVTCTNGSRWSLFQGWKERIPSSEMRWCSKTTQEVREQPTLCDRRLTVNVPGGTVELKWCKSFELNDTTSILMYVSIFVDFFRQIMEFTKEFSDVPLFKIWIGPLPLLVLFHAETVEVRSLTVTVCTQCSLCKLSMPTWLVHLSSMQCLQHIVTRSEKCFISFSIKKGNSRLKYFPRQWLWPFILCVTTL